MPHGTVGSMVRRIATAVTIVASVVLVPVSPALAADGLDQSSLAAGNLEFVHDVIVAAQTYIAGTNGSLNRVDLGIGRADDAGPLTVRIVTAPGGIPSTTVLATATVPLTAVPNDSGSHSVTVALPPSLSTAGSQYAIVLSAPTAKVDTAWLWDINTANGYSGGTAVSGDMLNTVWTVNATSDHTFATWVDPTPCAGGTYSSTGYAPCAPADPGHFAAGPGATRQAECARGTYQPSAGANACLPVPAGSYVDTAGATSPIACPAGTTTAEPGATSIDACSASDSTPPVIVAHVGGTLGTNGWYTSDVTLTWSVSDPETPASLVTTGCDAVTVTADQAPTTYRCSATSTGGSTGPVTVTIARDSTAPTATCAASPTALWPANGKLVPVDVTVSPHGASTVTLVSVVANGGTAADISGWTTGTPDTHGLLRASRGRTYSITYRVTDDAGNTGSCVVVVTVPHDQGGHGDDRGDGRGGDGPRGDGRGGDGRGGDNRR